MSDRPGLISIYVGHPDPTTYVEEMSINIFQPRPGRLPSVMDSALDWATRGAEPVWLGSDTAACAAAFDPSIFASQGADELNRYLAAAKKRGEPAILVATLGDANDDIPRRFLGSGDTQLLLPGIRASITGVRLPPGGRPSLAPNVPSADRDLGLRLLNRTADAPWWSLQLSAVAFESGYGAPVERAVPEGTLQPILIDALGDPVLAVWISPEQDQRWYIVPDRSNWGQIIDWVVRQALPAFAPDALRRARSPLFQDPLLLTAAESTAEEALADLEAHYVEARADLQAKLEAARTEASPVREGLLYSTGADLETAVRSVLEAAGFQTQILDEVLGGPKSADLLAVRNGRRLLVEVKSAANRASESLAGDLQRHLNTWPQLRPDEPVHGAVLFVNHQHRVPVHERSHEVYTRPEFISSLEFPTISTTQLFHWWRTANWPAIRSLLDGDADVQDRPGDRGDETASAAVVRRRWFDRLRRDGRL